VVIPEQESVESGQLPTPTNPEHQIMFRRNTVCFTDNRPPKVEFVDQPPYNRDMTSPLSFDFEPSDCDSSAIFPYMSLDLGAGDGESLRANHFRNLIIFSNQIQTTFR
jgi:hypothetical protein